MKEAGDLESLHFHTTASDGSWSYRESLDKCLEYGVGTIAFTDHDSLPSGKDLEELEELKSHKVKFIIGVEISASRVREVEGDIPLFHLVGLFVNPKKGGLYEYCDKRQVARFSRSQKMVKNLADLGFKIAWSDVLNQVLGKAVGRPHIAKALLSSDENKEHFEKLIVEVKSHLSDDELKRYNEMLSLSEKSNRIYPLLLSENALIKGVYVPYEEHLDMDEAVGLIREASGLAILAHWTFSKPLLSKEVVRKHVSEKRLDGVEVVYGINARERSVELNSDFVFLKDLVRRENVLRSGGGDIHNESDLKIFCASPLALETNGMAQEMIRKANPSREWSSIK